MTTPDLINQAVERAAVHFPQFYPGNVQRRGDFVNGARFAEEVLATPRVVSTVAELDALPAGSIVLSAGSTAYTRGGDGDWHSHFSDHTSELMCEPWNVSGPFTVIKQERPKDALVTYKETQK